MLDILEFNASLYSALEKNRNKKVAGLNRDDFLAHSSDGIAAEISQWLADYSDAIQEDGFGKKQAEPMLIHSAQLLRRGNAAKVSSELLGKLREARMTLSNIYEGRNEHLEHGQKWRKHKYIAIDPNTGRYIYEMPKGGSPVATGTVKQGAVTPSDVSNKMYAKWRDEERQKEEAKNPPKNESKEKIYDQIKNSKEVADYVNEIKKAYAAGLIKMSNKNPADFETTDKNWSDNRAYDALLETANKMEDYCKKLASESNGVTDWPEIRKELEDNIIKEKLTSSNNTSASSGKSGAARGTVNPNNTQGHQVTTESGRKNQSISARVFDGIAATELAKKKKRNDVRVVQHSAIEDISDGYKGLSEEEFRSLLGKTAN